MMLAVVGCGDDQVQDVLTTFGPATGDTDGDETVADTTAGPGPTEVPTTSAGDSSTGGADSSSGPGTECGNDLVEDGEECDGADLGGEDCISQGFDEGTLSCSASCSFDTNECVDWSCGDGEIQGREACDGDALGGEDCASQGFDEGTLACDERCALDTTGCVTWSCGNDVREGMEQCDGVDLGGEDCIGQGFDDGVLACDAMCALDTTACVTWSCGDGLVTAGEQCDGVDLGGQTCVSQGFDEGVLACDGACAFDTAGCITWVCGNGIVEGGEFCDGANLDGQDCATIGFSGGMLTCDAACTFDVAGCEIWICGNNVIEGAEVCDNLNLDGQTCATQGFDDGALGCAGDCSGFDTAGCFNWSCGDGLVTAGEDCDGMDLDGESCISQGFGGGTLACDPGSCLFDTSGCFACGDGVIGGGEQCDGMDLGGQDCTDQGFGGGTLGCAANCTLDTSGCVPVDGGDCCYANGGLGCEEPIIEACVCALDASCCNVGWDALCAFAADSSCNASCGGCGNDIIDQAAEVCDGTDLDGESCATQGLFGGTLTCAPDCSGFDTSACTSCGNGLIDAGEACDGAALGGQSCASLGLQGGVLGCQASCQFDLSGCTVPGTPFGSDSGYNGYELTPAMTTCDDISATGTATGLTDDDNIVVPIGFTFPFYGVDYTDANIQSNGTLRFGDATYLTFGNNCLPTATNPSTNTLYVYWDDLNPASAGDVYYQTLGPVGTRRFVVQWDVPHFGGDTGDLLHLQAMLSEATGQIDVCYVDTTNAGNIDDTGSGATAGIQENSADALQYSCNAPALVDGLQLVYVPI